MESTDDDKKLVSHYTYPDETSLFDLVYSFDWSLTPLGSMDSWSPSLKITVDLCLHTAFPTVIYYGLEHVMIYNQMYRPILQMKHPTALGSPAREVWTEIYDSLKLWIDEIFSNGKGQFRDDILLLMHREGYIEESYFSFTLSPIFGVDETVEGVFNVVQETTQRVLSARRLKTLSGLGNRALGAKTMESACHLVTSTLRDHNEDIHFSLIYIIDTHDNVSYKRANLVATTFDENLKMVKDDDGIEEWNFVKGNSTRELPDFLLDTFDTVCLQDKDSEHRISSYQGTASDANISSKLSTWPIKQVVALNSHLVVTLKDDKSKAILLPVHVSFAGRITLSAVIICGLNPRRALDREYLEFLQLVVSHVSSSLADSRSREEKKQAKILADLNRQKIMFSQNIDHGLMTPLTLMLSPLEESVKACFPDSPMLPDLQLINRSTRRLLKHTSTLLQFSRIEAGNLDAQFRETNIVKYTLELASSFENLAKSLKLSYLIQIPSYEEFYSELKNKVFVDRDMYEKIVFNLCSNAFKHTWTGNVTVRLYPDRINDKESVTLEVSDTGVGIPKDDVSNLFQRFYRIDSSQPRSREGTGIGLALVKELVTRHKGEISVYSELKKGTTFFISLPTGWEHLPEKQVYFVDEEHKLGLGSMDEYSFNERNLYLEESNQWTQDVPNDMDDSIDDTMDFDGLSVLDEKVEQHVFPSLSCDNTSKIHEVYYHILVVDENADMRNYLHRLLRKEFRVHCAYDGRDALRLLRKLPQLPDLILSDVIMPNMDGFELLKLLRSNPVTRLIPVILLSAKGEEDTGVEGLEHGADDYLVKPFSAEELIARVKVNIKLSCFWKQLLLQQKRQSETRELLFSISDKIRSGVNIEKVLNIAVEEFHRILPCDRIFLIRSDPLAFDFSHIMAFSASDPNEENLSGKSAAYVIETKDACIREFLSKHNISDFPQMSEESLKKIHDTLAETNDLIVLENYYTHILDRYVSVIGFPIKTNSSAWGWVLAHRSPNKTWSDSEKVFVQQISNQIGLAISHATLTEEKLKKEAQIEAAKAANEAKGQILANTSHELRTPLGAIIGVLSAFEDTPLTKDQKEMVHIMTRASDVVLSVVNNILDAAKLEAQKITLLNRTFDLLQVVEETLYILGEKAGNKQIELVLRYDHKTLPKYVKSDPDRLQQVLINLLSNSVKFTETGEVVLRISMASSNKSAIEENIVEKDTLFVEIIDTGIGIDSKFIKHIWESFAQADSSMTRRHDGTGLGLSICRHLVTINGGELGVTSELRKGSRFWFTWNVELLQTQPNANIQPSLSLSSTLRSERILVIDPVNTTRNTLVEFIEDHVKRVDAFDTAEKGVASAEMWKEQRNEVYDLVFFNIVEGNVEDVIKATKELKRISGEYRLCIVLMVFWSVRGRTLGREIMNEVGGQITTIYKPIMQNRVLECLYNNKSMTNEVYDFNVVKSLTDLKVEKYYHHNRPSAHINRSKDLSLKSNENTDKLKGIGEINNGESNQERTETLKRPTLKRMSSGADEISSEDDHTSKSRTRPTSKSKCVLCVEDNPINLKVIQHQLTKLGYRSLSATNGQEAVNLINNFVNHSNEGDPSSSSPNLPSDCREKISLVLMDCAMPVMSGYEASKAIREMESPISQVPIIALTASAIEGSKEKCLESGMNDFMTKPLKMSQLKEMLNKWLCD